MKCSVVEGVRGEISGIVGRLEMLLDVGEWWEMDIRGGVGKVNSLTVISVSS